MPKGVPKMLKVRAAHAERVMGAAVEAAGPEGSGLAVQGPSVLGPVGPGGKATCSLCWKEVCDEEHRKEIDCPNDYCPSSRLFHSDCLEKYLSKTRYSRDRNNGFPCPGVAPSGKPCPGYVVKIHTYQPVNRKKKEKAVQQTIANASAPQPKPKPAPPPKIAPPVLKAPIVSGVIKPVAKAAPTPVVRDIAGVKAANAAAKTTGLSIDEMRAAKERLRAEALGNAGRNVQPTHIPGWDAPTAKAASKPAKTVQVLPPKDENYEWDSSLYAPATVWDAVMVAQAPQKSTSTSPEPYQAAYKQPAGKDGNGFRQLLMQRRGATGSPASSEEGSASDAEDSGSWAGDEYPALASPDSDAAFDDKSLGRALSAEEEQPSGVTTPANAPAAEPEADPVVEYDLVYEMEGSQVVLCDVLQVYVRPEDVYGTQPALDMMYVPGEDGNTYLCVAVRESHRQVRCEWVQQQIRAQEAEAEAQALAAKQQQEAAAAAALQAALAAPATTAAFVPATALPTTTFALANPTCIAPTGFGATPNAYTTTIAAATTTTAPATTYVTTTAAATTLGSWVPEQVAPQAAPKPELAEDEDDDDVDSLLGLLGCA